MRIVGTLAVALAMQPLVEAQQLAHGRIIDVHLHALPVSSFGTPPIPTCVAELVFLPHDPRDRYGFEDFASCQSPILSARTDDDLMKRSLEMLAKYDMVAVASGPVDLVRKWRAAAPERIIPASEGSAKSIREWAAEGTIRVVAEVGFQYSGLGPEDSEPKELYALAEELDLPVGVHVGPGPPGAPYVGAPKYRMRLSDPLLFEDVLIRHPKLRLYVMHAGWPMADRMIALLYAHPQVYLDIGVIDWFIPRKEFHAYLKRLVDAGFGTRIMFGSDQMIWPDTIRIAIEGVESADFLTAQQKRDIFYENAARFLRLSFNQR